MPIYFDWHPEMVCCRIDWTPEHRAIGNLSLDTRSGLGELVAIHADEVAAFNADTLVGTLTVPTAAGPDHPPLHIPLAAISGITQYGWLTGSTAPTVGPYRVWLRRNYGVDAIGRPTLGPAFTEGPWLHDGVGSGVGSAQGHAKPASYSRVPREDFPGEFYESFGVATGWTKETATPLEWRVRTSHEQDTTSGVLATRGRLARLFPADWSNHWQPWFNSAFGFSHGWGAAQSLINQRLASGIPVAPWQ